MLVPLHDCFGYHYVLPRHSYALEDDGAVCAKRPSASDDIHHRDQLVGAKMALAYRQDDVPGFPQRRAYVFDDDIGAAHQGTVQLTSLRLMGSDCDHDRGVGCSLGNFHGQYQWRFFPDAHGYRHQHSRRE